MRVERVGHLVESLGEHREPLVQLAAHPGALAALPSEDHRDLARDRLAGEHPGVRGIGGQRGQRPQQGVAVLADHGGAVLEGGPRGRQRVGHVRGFQLRLAVHIGQEPGGLRADGVAGLARQHPRHGPVQGRPLLDDHRRGLFQDHVRVGAADAEGRDARAPRTADLGQFRRLGEQAHVTGGPVHVGRRLVDVQRLREDAVLQRHHHLDHPGRAGGGLRVPEVRLDRAEQQRAVAVLAVGGQQRLRLDRVTQRGTGAVCLDRVDV
ncbi:hypothetical protein GCM10027199_36100 [Amycolatopsis magusensis]